MNVIENAYLKKVQTTRRVASHVWPGMVPLYHQFLAETAGYAPAFGAAYAYLLNRQKPALGAR